MLLFVVVALVVLKMRNEETDSDRGKDPSPGFSHILAAKKIEVMRPDRLVTRGTTNKLQKNQRKMKKLDAKLEQWPPKQSRDMLIEHAKRAKAGKASTLMPFRAKAEKRKLSIAGSNCWPHD